MSRRESVMRKERSDKKYYVDCVIDRRVNELVDTLGYICEKPRQYIGEMLVVKAFDERRVIEHLQTKFRRSFAFNDTDFMFGDLERKKYRAPANATERLVLHVYKPVLEKIDELAYALGSSSKRAVAGLLISTAIYYQPIVASVVSSHSTVDQKRLQKLRVLFPAAVSGRAVY